MPRHGADDVDGPQRHRRRLADDLTLEDYRLGLAGYGGQVPRLVLVGLVSGVWPAALPWCCQDGLLTLVRGPARVRVVEALMHPGRVLSGYG